MRSRNSTKFPKLPQLRLSQPKVHCSLIISRRICHDEFLNPTNKHCPPPLSTNAKHIGVSEGGNKEKVRQFLAIHGDKFPSSKRFEIESLLTNSSSDSIAIAQGLSYKDRSTTLVLAFLCFDRFYLGQIGSGILKYITGGGFCIWWLIDLCNTKSRTQEYNYKLLVKSLQSLRC